METLDSNGRHALARSATASHGRRGAAQYRTPREARLLGRGTTTPGLLATTVAAIAGLGIAILPITPAAAEIRDEAVPPAPYHVEHDTCVELQSTSVSGRPDGWYEIRPGPTPSSGGGVRYR